MATAPTGIYTLSLHDALPILRIVGQGAARLEFQAGGDRNRIVERDRIAKSHTADIDDPIDRKSTRLNSSHTVISYAVFCLKKKNTNTTTTAPGATTVPRVSDA